MVSAELRVGCAAFASATREPGACAVIPSEAEFLAVDRQGNVYGAEVPGETLVKYARSR
jgi:hypothetical protein